MGREPMTAEECANILRATIKHRERMHQQDMTFIGPEGAESVGRINLEADELYHAIQFALTCVEGNIQK